MLETAKGKTRWILAPFCTPRKVLRTKCFKYTPTCFKKPRKLVKILGKFSYKLEKEKIFLIVM